MYQQTVTKLFIMKTNSLKHSATKLFTENGTTYRINVNIRLNDECNNGHEDFAITGTLYEKAKNGRMIDISGGCIHDDILKHFPQFKIFVDLHLCDFKGATMYPTANGFYNLKRLSKDEFLPYFGINSDDYEVLKDAQNKLHFEYLMNSINIFDKWQQNANKGIEYLQELTGQTFESKSTKQHHNPKTEDLKQFEGKTLEQIQQEQTDKENKIKSDKINKHLQDLKDRNANEIQKLNNNLYIKSSVAEILQTTNTNFIYYDHTNKLVFNWLDYGDQFTSEQISDFVLIFDNKLKAEITVKK